MIDCLSTGEEGKGRENRQREEMNGRTWHTRTELQNKKRGNNYDTAELDTFIVSQVFVR